MPHRFPLALSVQQVPKVQLREHLYLGHALRVHRVPTHSLELLRVYPFHAQLLDTLELRDRAHVLQGMTVL